MKVPKLVLYTASGSVDIKPKAARNPGLTDLILEGRATLLANAITGTKGRRSRRYVRLQLEM